MIRQHDKMLWLDGARGIYVPRDFATSFTDRAKSVSNVDDEQWEVLEAGPDHQSYWDVWDEVLSNAVVTDTTGQRYHLLQDGDLWLIPVGMVWSEELDDYVWPTTKEKR